MTKENAESSQSERAPSPSGPQQQPWLPRYGLLAAMTVSRSAGQLIITLEADEAEALAFWYANRDTLLNASDDERWARGAAIMASIARQAAAKKETL